MIQHVSVECLTNKWPKFNGLGHGLFMVLVLEVDHACYGPCCL